MHKSLMLGAMLSGAMVGLTGCPGKQVSTGTWLFTVTQYRDDGVSVMALNLEDGGSTQNPDPRPADVGLFNGAVTWMQNESTFTMSQVTNGGEGNWTYAGTVHSPTSMDGIWRRFTRTQGTWTAEKL